MMYFCLCFFCFCNLFVDINFVFVMINRICIVDCKIINKFVRIFRIFFGLWVLKVVVIILNIVKVNIFVKDRNNR